jgi:8-oxo-dGTP pyrophosphatase MutT (NUDIX family)
VASPPDPGKPGVFRATSRVLLIDADDRVLMFLQYGKDRAVPPRWITPGGGVDPGESHEQAGMRELFEETGLAVDALGSAFLDEDFEPDQRWHPYQRGHWAWYAVRVDHFDPSRAGWTDEELADVVEWRWFSAEELEDEHTRRYEVEPAGLADMLREEMERAT